MVGRLYAGGAALDVATALLAMRDGMIPPTVNLDKPAAGCELDFVTGKARRRRSRPCLSTRAGYGGFNSAMVSAQAGLRADAGTVRGTRTHAVLRGPGRARARNISAQLRPRRFAAREVIVAQGDIGDSLFVIQHGVAQVAVERDGVTKPLARLRRGDVVGEMSLVTGERRSASVVASVPTEVLELRREEFTSVLARHPTLLVNLSRILSRRLAHAVQSRRRGEAVALLTGAAAARLVPACSRGRGSRQPRQGGEPLPRAGRAAGGPTVDEALSGLDDLLAEHATVVLAGALEEESLRVLVDQVDRVLVVADRRGGRGGGGRARAPGRSGGAGGSSTPKVAAGGPPARARRRRWTWPPPGARWPGWAACSPAPAWAWPSARGAPRATRMWACCRCWRRRATRWIAWGAAASGPWSARGWPWA